MRITGLDESITKEEVRSKIVEIGECHVEEVKVGEIRWRFNGLGNIWAQCPLSSANKIMSTGKIKIGWTVARAEILTPRPLQCYRCWEMGHVQYSCTSEIDRSQHCYKCGSSTHRALECPALAPKCIICEEKGFGANYRLGSPVCNMIKKVNRDRPLPRIRREELEARNARNDKNAQNPNALQENPDRTTTETTMEIDHATLP